MSSAICLTLDQSKILLSGYGLNMYNQFILDTPESKMSDKSKEEEN